MEKPTGVIQKIIESLQQVNALNVYSPIEKDIILHNLRAAYMIFLNLPVEAENNEVRVDNIFPENQEAEEPFVEEEQPLLETEEPLAEEEQPLLETEEPLIEEEQPLVEEEPFTEEEPEMIVEAEGELQNAECGMQNAESITNNLIIESNLSSGMQNAECIFINRGLQPADAEEIAEAPPVFQDDLLEFIPDAKPNTGFLFEDSSFPKSEKKSLNDLLTEKKDDQSLGTRFQQSFIPDLTKAIGINEKFAFIRELFHNSGVDFSSAIQKLNDCENIDAAFVLMETLKHQYLWDTTSTSYLSLCDLVRRRFL